MALVSSNGLGQTTRPTEPWMFFPQNKDFGQTSFCKKYYCSTRISIYYDPPESKNIEAIRSFHSTFEMGYKGRFDVFRNAFYEVVSMRSPLYGPKKHAPTGIYLSMDSEVRYSIQMKKYLDKNLIEPQTEELLNDFLKVTVGKTYPKSKLLTCLRLKNGRYNFENKNLDAPKGTPIRTLNPLPPNPPPFYSFSVGCESGNDLISISLEP
jgi:hypothetical protein